jgi:hypothetical protein
MPRDVASNVLKELVINHLVFVYLGHCYAIVMLEGMNEVFSFFLHLS